MPPALVGRIDDADVIEAYEADRALARTAAGSPTEFQGKSAATDGPVRYTAPSLVFERDGKRLEAGGFQPDRGLRRDPGQLRSDARAPRAAPRTRSRRSTSSPTASSPPRSPRSCAHGLFPADRGAAEDALIDAAARGDVVRVPVGDDAVWLAARYARESDRFVRASSIAAASGVMPPAAAS